MAYGSSVNYIIAVFIEARGSKTNLDGSISTPIQPEITGILNFLR